MLNNNHHNSSCGFAEQMISYLYGEVNDTVKVKFEIHLRECSVCAEELADFTVLRSSIIDWRQESFSGLETPFIELPSYTGVNSSDSFEVSNVTRSWLKEIRRIFSLSPAWATATTAFAVLAILGGLTLVGMYLASDKQEIAGGEKQKPVITPSSAKSNSVNESPSDNKPEENPERENSITNKVSDPGSGQEEPLNGSNPETSQKTIVKTVNTPDKSTEIVTPTSNNKPKRDVKKIEQKVNTQKAPRLNNFEEDEDETLRLTDLFEEIDARK